MPESESDMIRRCATKWLRDNEPLARGLLKANPDMTVEELQEAMRWTKSQTNSMVSYLQMVGL